MRTPYEEIDHMNAWLDRLDALEQELRVVQLFSDGSTRAEEFERVHRVALRAAGVVRERANMQRRRPLPLSVWEALRRLGGAHAARAAQVEPFVQLRQRAEASASGKALITAVAVREHREQTLAHISLIRSELMEVMALAA